MVRLGRVRRRSPPRPGRRFCYTIFNFDQRTVDLLKLVQGVIYHVFQVENCPETGRPHLQGFIHLRTVTRPRRLRTEILGAPTAHIENSEEKEHGWSDAQWKTYCTDETKKLPEQNPMDTPYEQGNPGRGQGTQPGLQLLTNQVFENVGTCPVLATACLARTYPLECIRHRTGILGWTNTILIPPPWRHVTVIVYWGATGIGKSRLAGHIAPNAYWASPPRRAGETLWFDDYDRQDTIILDDFDPSWWSEGEFKRYTDGHPVRLHVRGGGGSVPCWATKWIFTSNMDPYDWYYDADLAINRRITWRIHL